MKSLKSIIKIGMLFGGLAIVTAAVSPPADTSATTLNPTAGQNTLEPRFDPSAPLAPAAKTGVSHDLIVTNKKHKSKKDQKKYNKTMAVCRHWDYPKGHNKDKKCPNDDVGLLKNGENSKTKLKWDDVDAIMVYQGYKVMVSVPGPDRIWIACNDDGPSMYYKVSPPPWKVTLWLKKC